MFDSTEQGVFADIFREMFSGLDMIVYGLLSYIYEIFYRVATASIISGETIRNFYSRVQLILGIIIMFKVAVSLFNGIINPDSFSNEKTGFSSVIKKIILVLVMLVMLVPLNIPGVPSSASLEENSQQSWNARLNENGILFGTMYELQSRILSQNTISKLILGVDNDEESDIESYRSAGQELSIQVLKCFVTINPKSENADTSTDDGRMCKGSNDEEIQNAYDKYDSGSITTYELLSMINLNCDDGNLNFLWIGDKNYYAFSYTLFLSTVIGVLFVIIIVSFTIDAAIRVFKLAILRLIAPIPILSYIDPKTEKTFQNWVKVVGTTFAELFVRLIIINFVVFFVKEFNQGIGVSVAAGGYPGVQIFSKIFIYLGLIMFAKQAPQFILDTLGIKQSKGLLSGLAGLAGGISSARNRWKAARAAQTKNVDENNPEKHSWLNRGKALAQAIGGGAISAGDVYHDYAKADGGMMQKWRSSLDKNNSLNAWRMANAEAGGSWLGRTKQQAQADFTGDTSYYRQKREVEQLKNQADELNSQKKNLERQKSQYESASSMANNLRKMASDEVTKKGAKVLLKNGYFDKDGNSVMGINSNLKDLEAIMKTGESTGNYVYQGHTFTAAQWSKIYSDALDNATDSYMSGTAKFADGSDMKCSATFKANMDNVITSLNDLGYQANVNSLRDDIKKATDGIGQKVAELQPQMQDLDNQIYENTRSQEEANNRLKTFEVDSRGNDGYPGGK